MFIKLRLSELLVNLLVNKFSKLFLSEHRCLDNSKVIPPVNKINQEVHTLPTPFASEACECPKGTIKKHHRTKHGNPHGGVRVKPGKKPIREVVPKCQDINDEDFAGGVTEGTKVILQAKDNPKTSAANPKI